MKYSMVVYVLIGFMCVVVAGCGMSESDNPQDTKLSGGNIESGSTETAEISQASSGESRSEYVQLIEGQFEKLIDNHAKLVGRAQEAGSGTQVEADLGTVLDDLTKQGQVVQQQIDELKAAKPEDWNALQPGMNKAMEELAQSYDQAFTKYAG